MLKLPTRQTAPQSAKTLWKNANLKVRDFLNSMCFSGPSFLGMLIFYLVPFGVVIYYSFIAGVVDNSFVGLKNYIAVFNNAAFRTAAKNTAVFTGLAVPLAVVLSAFIDNIPYVATMLPVVQGIAALMNNGAGMAPEVFYFGLLTGATLGGNLTPIGASANIAAIGILRKNGETVRTADFLRIGVPFTLAAVLTGSVYLWLVWGRAL